MLIRKSFIYTHTKCWNECENENERNSPTFDLPQTDSEYTFLAQASSSLDQKMISWAFCLIQLLLSNFVKF